VTGSAPIGKLPKRPAQKRSVLTKSARIKNVLNGNALRMSLPKAPSASASKMSGSIVHARKSVRRRAR
jgi:hypothetical protein